MLEEFTSKSPTVPSKFHSASLPCTTKDIQGFVIRKLKYMRIVHQFNEDEPLPSHLLSKFFKSARDCKAIKTFNLKWNYTPSSHTKPAIVKKVFKKHCQSIQKFSSMVSHPSLRPSSSALIQPLKHVTTASISTDKAFHRILALKHLTNLKINIQSVINCKHLYLVLSQLQSLRSLHVTCAPIATDSILLMMDELASNRKEIQFEISVSGGQGNLNTLDLQKRLTSRITEMNFQLVPPNQVLSNLFTKLPFIFDCLQVLKLEFQNISVEATSYFHNMSKFTKLERLNLVLSQCQDTMAASSAIRNLHIPESLQTLELTFPLHLSSLLTSTRPLLDQNDCVKKEFPWRKRNIFEEEPAFKDLLSTFSKAQSLKTIAFDFYMLENYHSHYTNFIISILNRIPNLKALEIQLKDIVGRNHKDLKNASFDLALFFGVCSQMKSVEQIDILMPNLLFKDATLTSTSWLKSLTIGVNEDEEDNPIKFQGINREVERLIKDLLKNSPNLGVLSLDFAEAVSSKALGRRFLMIQKFAKLEALGLRFFVENCQPSVAQDVGKVLKSLDKLTMLLLKFFKTNKEMFAIENYIKYHKSIRNILVQFNETAWMDNECLLDPLNCHIKGNTVKSEDQL